MSPSQQPDWRIYSEMSSSSARGLMQILPGDTCGDTAGQNWLWFGLVKLVLNVAPLTYFCWKHPKYLRKVSNLGINHFIFHILKYVSKYFDLKDCIQNILIKKLYFYTGWVKKKWDLKNNGHNSSEIHQKGKKLVCFGKFSFNAAGLASYLLILVEKWHRKMNMKLVPPL